MLNFQNVRRHFRGFTASIAVATCLAGAGPAQAGLRSLPGHVPDAARGLQPMANVPSGTSMHLSVGLPLQNKTAMTNLMRDLYDPASPNFRRFLTPAQFADQFGPTAEEYQKTRDYLAAQGLKLGPPHANRMVVEVSGTAANVQKAFHVNLRVYPHPTEKRNFFAPDSEPSVDSDVPMQDVMGLNNYILPHSIGLERRPLGPSPNSSVTNYAEVGSGPGGTYIGNDFRAAYVPGVTNTGTGQHIALVEFGPYYLNDITTYENQAGLSASSIVVSNIFLDGVTEPPAAGTDAGEQALDIEMCISMAPGATVLYYGGESVDDIYSRIASDNLAKQISCSFGFGIDSTTEQLYQEFVLQGQNFFQASGDGGAEVGVINPPACEPYITLVGGTDLYTVSPGGAYQSELAWVGSGGGTSTFYAIPDYQQGINMTPIYGSSTMRNFPDVSMMADTVIFIAANNGMGAVGGTSCSSPQWAGFYALANQRAASLGQPAIGFFNPILYTIGKSANYTKCFHDITSGNTTNAASGPHKYFAASGYDLATGWGSPNGSNLMNALTSVGTNNFFLYPNPEAFTIVQGGTFTSFITVQPMNKFSGSVSLSLSNLPAGVNAVFSAPTTASTSVLTLTATPAAAPGANTVTLIGTSGVITKKTALTIVVQSAIAGATKVSLSGLFNTAAIYTDGTSFGSGGADGGGNAYSATLLGSGLNWNGCLFTEGPLNGNDAIKCSGQSITLPSGMYSSLNILATAVDGDQTGQTFTVNYTDGTSSSYVQSLSDWTGPEDFPGESLVDSTPYKNSSGGSKDTVSQGNIYGYSFGLNSAKSVKSIKLPSDGNVLIFAMTLANDFDLYASPASFVLTDGGRSVAHVLAGPIDSNGIVALSASGLPTGVTATFNPAASATSSLMTLVATPTAQPVNTNVILTGTWNGLVHNITIKLSTVTPIPNFISVPIASAYNLGAIVTDGAAFSGTGGMDGAGNAYSSALIGATPNWNGATFSFGAAGGMDAVQCQGQTISIAAGQFPGLLVLGAAINAPQPNQTFQIHYTDGSSTMVTQSVSYWQAPQNYAGESIAISTAYTDVSGGAQNMSVPASIYGYVLPLDDSRTAQSIALPNNTNVVIFGMAAGNVSTPVSLTQHYNNIGIYYDGATFGGGAGAGGTAYSYSANALDSNIVWDSAQFKLGPSNAPNVVECLGQTISLPTNRFTSILMLAAAVNNAQLSQAFTVAYTDGTTASIVQSFSDWVSVTAYTNQTIAAVQPYRLLEGGVNSSTTHVYGYLFPLNNTKMVQSIKLPNNRYVDILALSLGNTPLPVSLQADFNRAGMYTDGAQFTAGTGLDNDGNALSASLLGASEFWHNSFFEFGIPNKSNTISAAGQVIALPPGQFSSMLMLATSVNGSQTGQKFVVTYTNGTTTTLTASMSDWASSSGFSGESIVAPMAYRDSYQGSEVGTAVKLYGYSLALNSSYVAKSVTMPSDANVEVFAITMSNYTAALSEAPSISPASEPQNLIVAPGSPAIFAVGAIGSPTLVYQWQKNGANLTNGGNIAGATTSQVTISPASTNDDGGYSVGIVNGFGSVTSVVATLTVGNPPSITNQPVSLTVTNGQQAVFSVGAAGDLPLAYQWQFNTTNLTDGGSIVGSSTSTLTLASATAANAGNYQVIVTNSFGNVTSSVVALNVVFTFQAAVQNGNTVSFSWLTTPGVSYQVQYTTDLSATNWINLGGPIVATGNLTTNSDNLGPDSQRFYRVIQQ